MEVQEIHFNQELFILHHSGAMYWKEQSILLIADVHLGKAAHFRKHGSAIPADLIQENLKKLSEVMAFFSPEKVFFMGDLFHSALNSSWRYFEAWVQKNTDVKFTLIEGNHDIINPLRFEALGFQMLPELSMASIYLTHEPKEKEGFLNICGHIHPGICLQGLGRQQLKIACFYKTKRQLVMPAFGNFTGKYILELENAESIWGIAEHQVIEVKHTN